MKNFGSTTKRLKNALLLVLLLGSFSFVVHAQEYTSTNFKVLEPVLFPSGYGTSTNFTLTSTLSQLGIGTSTSASFGDNSGFLYFPFVSLPSVTATTAGDNSVDLSWTASTGALGFTVSGYNVGQSTSATGPFTYSSLGATTTSTRSGLTAGTTYYFVIRPEDAFGNTVASSTVASATTSGTAPSGGSSSSGSGGGGNGPIQQQGGTALFSGRAYPNALVSLLKGGQVVGSIGAQADGTFELKAEGVSPGKHLFSVNSRDKLGDVSPLATFVLDVKQGGTVSAHNIFLAPTIRSDKSEVRAGDSVTLSGFSAPLATVIFSRSLSPDAEALVPIGSVKANQDGFYSHRISVEDLPAGEHFIRARGVLTTEQSYFSRAISLLKGGKTVVIPPQARVLKGDLNSDNKVNLVDFSIAAFWFSRAFSERFAETERVRLNGDGKINLTDFSLIAFYWTG